MKVDLKDFKLLDGRNSYVEELAAIVVVILYVVQFFNKKSEDNTDEASL